MHFADYPELNKMNWKLNFHLRQSDANVLQKISRSFIQRNGLEIQSKQSIIPSL